MSGKFFGQFLLEKGKILKEELLDALEFQKNINVKLGTIALDSGYLNSAQIEKIHQEQHRTDKLFGEIAIELNYLTSEQLEELLTIQKNERISFGDALMQKGYISLQELESELKLFKEKYPDSTEEVKKTLSKAPKLSEIFVDTTIKLLRRLGDLSTDIVEYHEDSKRIAPYLWNVYQEFYGDLSGILILSVNEPAFLKIASTIADEKFIKIDDFAKDGMKEFINVVLGNTITKLSGKDINVI